MKRRNVVLMIIFSILIISILGAALSYRNFQNTENKEINQLKQEIENCNNSVNNLTQQLKVKEGTCGIDIQNMASELEGKNEYLARIDNEMTSCLNDSDCTRVYNGCCATKILNVKYADLWQRVQGICNMGCISLPDLLFALCEDKKCVLKSLTVCDKKEDCKSYDGGCLNKEHVVRSNMTWYFKESNQFECNCSIEENNQCIITRNL